MAFIGQTLGKVPVFMIELDGTGDLEDYSVLLQSCHEKEVLCPFLTLHIQLLRAQGF